jgi:hypothetical protein
MEVLFCRKQFSVKVGPIFEDSRCRLTSDGSALDALQLQEWRLQLRNRAPYRHRSKAQIFTLRQRRSPIAGGLFAAC